MSFDHRPATAEPVPAGEPIAIIGVGLRFPGGSTSLDEFEAFLRAGASGISPLPGDRFDVDAFTPSGPDDKGKIKASGGGYLDRIDLFDAGFFNISPKEAQYIDPQQRMILETAWQALEHANIDPTPLRRSSGSVYVGASSVDYALELDQLPYEDLDGHLASGITLFPLAGRLSYFLGWRGPSISVDTACSSSLAALHMAVTALRRGESDIALGGGVNALHHPRIPVMFSNAQMLAPDGQCKTFDESADGYARAEGCSVVVLKRLSDARRDGDRVLALIRGTAVGQDGDSAGLTVPNGPAQERVLRLALADAGLEPGDISYVEAHGTGTPLGDPIELGAISNVFTEGHSHDDPLLVGSVKTNLGHMEPASGLAGVIKVLAQLRSATIYPHLNFTTPSGRIPWEVYPVRVPTAVEPWRAPVRRAAVNSFGFAGTIGAVVLEQAPDPGPVPTGTGTGARAASTQPQDTQPQEGGERAQPAAAMFTLSAKSSAALREQAARYREFLTERPGADIARLCYTANTGRAHFTHRVAAPVTDRESLLKVLERVSHPDHAVEPSGIRKIAFMFTGQGSQYPGMGATAYRQFPLFRRVVDECDALFAPHLQRSVRDLLLGRGERLEDIEQTRYTQPALFTLEYALARLWLSWGVKPTVLIGHSIGEVVAATVAGLFTLPDAVTLVAARSRLMQSVRTSGGMAAVSAPAEQIQPLLVGRPLLALAAVNGPEQCVISGADAELAEVSALLAEQGVRVNDLTVSHAFHSPLMAEVFEEFRTALASITFGEPTISLISNVTGKVARSRELRSAEYWVRHIGEPVHFMAGMRALARRGKHALIEIGPSAMLTALAKPCVKAEDHLWLTSLRRRDTGEGTGTTLRALADLYGAGLSVDWHGYHDGRTLPAQDLPTYAFQRKRYWLPTPTARGSRTGGGPLTHPLLGEPAAQPQPGGQTQPDAQPQPGGQTQADAQADGQAGGQVAEFRAEFVPAELGELAAHHRQGEPVLPGAALVDLLFAAQDAVAGHTRGALTGLELPQALALREDGVVRLTTRLRRTGPGRLLAEVRAGAEGQDQLLARARIEPALHEPVPQAPAAAGRVVERVEGADLAADLRAVGRTDSAGAARVLHATRHEGDLVTGEVRGRSAGAVEQLPGELLEAVLQALVAFQDAGPLPALHGARSIRLFKKPRGRTLHFTAALHPAEDELRADVTLFEDGEAVADVRGARLARPAAAQEGPHFTHRVQWLRHSLAPAPAAGAATAARHVLVCATTAAARDTLAAHLAAGQEETGLRLTPAATPADVRSALEHSGAEEAVHDVAWFWQPQQEQGQEGMSLARLRAECARNLSELLELVAALGAAGGQQPPRLWLVTERAQWLPADLADGGEQLAAATVWGFGSVLLGEYPQLKTTLIDLPAGGDAAALLAEWRSPQPGEHQVAYRGGQRHVRRVLPGDTTPAAPGPVTVVAPAFGDLEHTALAAAAPAASAPAGGEVRVRVDAAALTAKDVPAVAAVPAPSPEGPAGQEPAVTASAYAGTVTATAEAGNWPAGTRVTVRHPGPLASTVTVPHTALAPAPEGLSPAQAAAHAARTLDDASRDASPVAAGVPGAAVYGLDEVGEALRVLSAAPAPGGAPVVVAFPPQPAEDLGARAPGGFTVRKDRTYVVTGGLGGLGLATARKLADLGARHLVLVSRSGRPAQEAAQLLTELTALGADVQLVRADLGRQEDVAALVERLRAQQQPVAGIVHAAGAMGNSLISALTWEIIEEQLAPKVYGGWLLHEAAASFPELDFFTLYSSVASVTAVRGGAGQAHYAAAFAFLDSLAHWRSRQGLPAVSVNWGSWGRVGMSARMEAAHIAEIERSGVRLFSPAWGLRALHRLWRQGAAQRIVNVYDWPQFASRLPAANALYARVLPHTAQDGGGDLADLLARPAPEQLKLISRVVAEKVAAVLHFESADEVEPGADFVGLGLDSVMGMEVKGSLQSHFGVGLPAALTFDYPSVRKIAEFLQSQLSGATG
ncbi:type I polyketide synthase [Streptomyces silvensis]|uniref:Beta-ketoacyl synthase n=1 Tax=Streptomyces silvensis TaxID=1765722 RepID=A0A0W7X8I4_9ACTN|nr:type I polyketide synthase [Streptomyces silvensis]KUF19105.1 beta-ketoacyl synthase [Streptomyces silvensis]